MLAFSCQICKQTYPISLHHEHHKIPKSLGGSDDKSNLANLCHTCHNNLHLIAYMIVNPKRRHEIEPTLASILPGKPDIQRELLGYANLVAKEMALKKEIRKEADQEVRTIVELPARYMELLRLAGYDRPHANGKRSGVALMIRHMVAEGLAARYPLLKEEIQKYKLKKPKDTNSSK